MENPYFAKMICDRDTRPFVNELAIIHGTTYMVLKCPAYPNEEGGTYEFRKELNIKIDKLCELTKLERIIFGFVS